jgi:hypothetical protein
MLSSVRRRSAVSGHHFHESRSQVLMLAKGDFIVMRRTLKPHQRSCTYSLICVS